MHRFVRLCASCLAAVLCLLFWRCVRALNSATWWIWYVALGFSALLFVSIANLGLFTDTNFQYANIVLLVSFECWVIQENIQIGIVNCNRYLIKPSCHFMSDVSSGVSYNTTWKKLTLRQNAKHSRLIMLYTFAWQVDIRVKKYSYGIRPVRAKCVYILFSNYAKRW